MGDFYISEKYLELREKWGKILDDHCTGLVKQRTIMNNYAPVYATLEYYHSVFRSAIKHPFKDKLRGMALGEDNVHLKAFSQPIYNCFSAIFFKL